MAEDMGENDTKVAKIAVYAGFSVLAVFFLSISSCTAIQSAYEADTINAKAQLVKERNLINVEQNKAIQELIEMNVNPIAARCAIMGFDTDEGLCGVYGSGKIDQQY